MSVGPPSSFPTERGHGNDDLSDAGNEPIDTGYYWWQETESRKRREALSLLLRRVQHRRMSAHSEEALKRGADPETAEFHK